MSTFIGVLKPTPSAYVVDQDVAEIGAAGLDVVEQLNQAGPVFKFEATFTSVAVCSDDLKTM